MSALLQERSVKCEEDAAEARRMLLIAVGKDLLDSEIIDLLIFLFRGAVFHRGGVPENCPFNLAKIAHLIWR